MPVLLKTNITIAAMITYTRNISLESESETSSDDCFETVEDILVRALKEDVVTRGIFKCAHVLETCPEIVCLCVLPNLSSMHIGTVIQHKLIEAYCWENEIEILKMDNARFMSFVKGHKSSDSADVGCFLVTTISAKTIHEHMDDEDLLQYDKDDSR